jgi:ABC-type multidrug transport system ATPase subunit
MQLMRISVIDAGKRFNREWIFRNLNLELNSGNHYAITGHNGSGKSTLLQCIAGALYISEGSVSYSTGSGQLIDPAQVYQQLSICAPYLEVIEEMSAREFLEYHGRFKPFFNDSSPESILQEVGLTKAADKQIRYYSSGMKQRVKLAQAFFSDTPVLLLDEPCTNLDQEGISVYQYLVSRYCKNRLVLISSNDTTEYASCNSEIRMGV